MLFSRLPALFKDVPGENGDVSLFHEVQRNRETSPFSPSDFREKVEEEIREALLGARALEPDYATGDAFVLSSVPAPKSLLDALSAIPRRGSLNKPQEQVSRLAAERTLRYKSDVPTGAVIFAAPAPPVYYQQWYLLLLLDRLIHRTVRLPLQTSLLLNVRPYYYRIELPLGVGQFPEPGEENLLQELQRLQLTQANPRDLSAARQDALAYLDSANVKEWFASHGISERRDEGVHWLESMTADDMRAAARDLLIMNRVVASWAARPKETTVSVEPLTSSSPRAVAKREPDTPKPKENVESTTAFPAHNDPPTTTTAAERLPSGVFLAPSNVNAVFVSGGALTRFNHETSPDDLKSFSSFRAERILVLAPTAALAGARQVWSNFKGSTTGSSGVPKGNVSTGDLPAMFILKTLLDLKVVESGWWRDVYLRIDATQGSSLQIVADDQKRAQILDWIKAIATTPPSEKYFNWVREVAVHRFWIAMPDLQALIWERDPQGTVLDLSTVTPQLVQDVARIYF
jgi:hypothetical protein